MHGRKLITAGTVAALAILAVVGGCREATTGPTTVHPQDFASSLKLLTGNQQTGAVGVPLPELLSVKVVDAGGQAVAGATVIWQVRDGGGTISPAASTSSSSGLATVTWTLGTTLGANKVVAILQGNYTLDSAVFTATAKTGAANTLTLTSGNQQVGRVATLLGTPLTVNVKDQFGYPVAGAKVTWAPGNIFSGTVVAVKDSTDATGNASANWRLGPSAIAQTVTATVAGLPPITFNATGTADTSRVIIVAGGGGQSAPVGSPIALRVQVKDQYGNPILGDTIAWNDSIGSGGSVSPLTSVTDASGFASTSWRLGERAGAQLLRLREGASGKKLVVQDTATVQLADIQAGNFHVCALSTSAKIYCWGLNDVGQLGKGTNAATSVPTTAVSLLGDTLINANYMTARSLSGTRSSTCALTVAQIIYCWGRRWGSLATSALPLTFDFNANAGAGAPLAINFVQVSEDHACLIQVSGIANCTGNNDLGQLGDKTPAPFPSPGASVWPYVDNRESYSNIVLGTSFSCGMRRFDPADANRQIPLCWGDGSMGQRGVGGASSAAATANSSVPTLIQTSHLPAGIRFDSAAMAAGAKHACAVAIGGATYCWGLNAHGQLGNGVAAPDNSMRDSVAKPVALPAGIALSRIYAGKYHTCGLTAAGLAYCWGRNDYAQLGDGTRTAFNTGTATPVAVQGGYAFRSLTIGELFTCGVVASQASPVGPSSSPGTVYCWGDNTFGQIGNGTIAGGNAPVLTPTRVSYQQP